MQKNHFTTEKRKNPKAGLVQSVHVLRAVSLPAKTILSPGLVAANLRLKNVMVMLEIDRAVFLNPLAEMKAEPINHSARRAVPLVQEQKVHLVLPRNLFRKETPKAVKNPLEEAHALLIQKRKAHALVRGPQEPERKAKRNPSANAAALLEPDPMVLQALARNPFKREIPIVAMKSHSGKLIHVLLAHVRKDPRDLERNPLQKEIQTVAVMNPFELAWRRLRASTDVCRHLNIPDGSEVFELFRVRTADGRPVTVSFDYVSTATIPDQPALLGPSFYSFLADVCGVRIRYGVAELIPATADAAIAAHLGTAQGALCLLLRQVDFDEANKPISYSVEYHLADAFRFELLRSGHSASADATG